jgi:hypothetical protein
LGTLSEIRGGLQRRLQSIAGLRASDVWPDQINCPQALVKPLNHTFRLKPGTGFTKFNFEVVFLAAPLQNSLERAQRALDPYLDEKGPKSIKEALEADDSLGGVANGVQVTGWREYGSLEVNGIEYLGVKFDVEVWP